MNRRYELIVMQTRFNYKFDFSMSSFDYLQLPIVIFFVCMINFIC